MYRHLINLFAITLLFVSCAERSQPENQTVEESTDVFLIEAHQAFFDNLASLCGNKFKGEETYTAEGRDNWQGKALIMEVILCTDENIHISLAVDDDHSRTWMFMAEEGQLRFRHDHRHVDGTPEEVTLYGGYATNAGNALVQYFPADDYTCQLIDYACKNEWVVMLSDDMSKFSYILSLDGVMRFQADFDLSHPL